MTYLFTAHYQLLTYPMLYLVPTPIGNLKDITLRALEVLKNVDLIVCEDTRQTLKLLNHYQIKKRLESFHAHSDERKLEQLIQRLRQGEEIALVSDAGTPGISDPGFKLTSRAWQEKIKVIPLPGPSAFLTALSGSGLPINQFVYLGFLPVKKGRQKVFKQIKTGGERTFVLYEAPHRLRRTLFDLEEHVGEVEIVIARELTKIYEEFWRGTAKEALEYFKNPRGEFVIIVRRQESN